MALRKVSTAIGVNVELEIHVLDNGDILLDWLDSGNDALALEYLNQEIETHERLLETLTRARDLVADGIRGFELSHLASNAVSPFYNIVGSSRCVDCDEIEALTVSQFGEVEEENLVCVSCEQTREFEYGIPPETAKEQ